MSSKKLLRQPSDLDKISDQDPTTPGAAILGVLDPPSKKVKDADDLFNFGGKTAGEYGDEEDDEMARLETIDAFVGPVKKEFNDLKKKIEDKNITKSC